MKSYKTESDYNIEQSTDKLNDGEIEEILLNLENEVLEKYDVKQKQASRRLTKFIIWIIAITMIVQTFAFFLQTYSIPAIEFLKISAKLSKDEQISTYKKAVVTIVSSDSKGTGFSISSDGLILTNYHVIEDKKEISVVFPDEGRFDATIRQTAPDVDLALLEINGKNLPRLQLANETSFANNEHVYFIGNPLRFHGIANEGTVIDYITLQNWNNDVVMIEAPVYRGNSGSPIINSDGHVIGVVFATLKHDDYGKVGLFIPIDYYYEMMDS